MTLLYLYTDAGHPSPYDTDVCCMFQRGLIPRAKETLVTLIFFYADAGHPSPYDTDVLHVSAGPHTPSQGDSGDPDILVYRCWPPISV